ncbi:uncharacterized protein PV07_07156 [Cladophialophora immunda]|uniref:Uncharacterized protein n=1 Tax=Cladophialophora immunda TaxID=569365 RepID=A0A0D2C8K3_9EURO|nr:uncharacterized protein PV07_07156 [Cladophialophora immunda]KIW27418.1 hypothetical protein PV07_07156 [Cladophialophora immunda]
MKPAASSLAHVVPPAAVDSTTCMGGIRVLANSRPLIGSHSSDHGKERGIGRNSPSSGQDWNEPLYSISSRSSQNGLEWTVDNYNSHHAIVIQPVRCACHWHPRKRGVRRLPRKHRPCCSIHAGESSL